MSTLPCRHPYVFGVLVVVKIKVPVSLGVDDSLGLFGIAGVLGVLFIDDILSVFLVLTVDDVLNVDNILHVFVVTAVNIFFYVFGADGPIGCALIIMGVVGVGAIAGPVGSLVCDMLNDGSSIGRKSRKVAASKV